MSTAKRISYRSIFYSLITGLLIYVGIKLHAEETRQFVESWELWREPLIAGIICGIVSGLLGVYILLNRIVFISLAISQSAGFGIFFFLFIAGLFGISLNEGSASLAPGFLVALGTAFLFAGLRKRRMISDESLIGLIYVITAGLTLLLGDKIAEGHHIIDNLLFGNAVAVTGFELKILLAVSSLILLIHYLFRREFIYVSADPEFMKVQGFQPQAWMTLFYLTLTLGITFNLRTLGSLPVFTLMVIPPFIALKGAQGIREVFLVSIGLGLIIPPLGYFYSFLFSFPTGASLILVSLFYLVSSLAETLVLKKLE